MGSYGSLASYISGLSSRFTNRDQVTKLTSFADQQTELLGSSVATLRTAIQTAEYELYWDSQHLATVASIVDVKVNGGASVPVCMSFFVVAIGVVVNTLLQG